MTDTRLAQLAYQAYGEQTDFKNYQGNPMPAWDDLGDAIQDAWLAAADAVAEDVQGSPSNNTLGSVSD